MCSIISTAFIWLEDGQKQAKRLAKSITKGSGNLRKFIKKYNSSVEILRQKGYDKFVDLTWEMASDVSSSIYNIGKTVFRFLLKELQLTQ